MSCVVAVCSVVTSCFLKGGKLIKLLLEEIVLVELLGLNIHQEIKYVIFLSLLVASVILCTRVS